MSLFISDLDIANKSKPEHIFNIADKLNINTDLIELYGNFKAKLPLSLIDEEKVEKSKLILVTALTPTPPGEGKTTVSIGLSDGLNKIGERSTVVLREPSLGPVFGMKGGATGGGYSQVIPMEDINLHFTGDFAAIEKANNLIAALIDNTIQNKSATLNIDPRTIEWKRVADMNDRALRNIVTGMGGKTGGIMRETGFNITAASEIMAILCLATSIDNLKNRIGQIYIGDTFDGKAVFVKDIKAEGAATLLLKDAIKPNLVQTLENNPAILHGGPFANIAQGTNSVLATKIGLSLSDYVVTEAGFGADLGAEKFFHIKCQQSGLSPRCVVLVATIRALKYHGGVDKNQLSVEDITSVKKGLPNLGKHIENLRKFHVPVVVAINKFPKDTSEEISVVQEFCKSLGVSGIVSEGWEKGSEGTVQLAKKVRKTAEAFNGRFTSIYESDEPIKEKIHKIATRIYGASSVDYLPKALQNLTKIERLGMIQAPICIAKTQNSFSDNPKLYGRPEGFILTIREIEIARGANFIIPITGNMLRMPGLPAKPAAELMDIDNNGRISGLS